MASLKCAFCGYVIHHHGEPEGTEPVQYIFCTLDNWRELEKENLTADWLELEHDEIFFYAWRCARCGTFSFFNDRWYLTGIYAPNEKISSDPMKDPFEFGPFWDDFQWFDITEDDIHASGNSDAFKLSLQSQLKQCRLSPSKKCWRTVTT